MTSPTETALPDLWTWALAVYAEPAVAAACLALQDEHGQCVPLLLWSVWADRRGVRSQALALRAADLARAWSDQAITPLRAVRRALKPPMTGIDADGRERLRQTLKADELEAERLLLTALEAITPAANSAQPPDALDALRLAASAWGASEDAVNALGRLAGSFPRP